MSVKQTLKRVKGGKALYAKRLAPGGNVIEWVENEAEAKQFDVSVIEDRDLANAAAKHYGKMLDAGVFTIGGKPVNDAEKALAEEAARAKEAAESMALLRDKAARFDVAERARIVAEEKCKKLEAEIAELKKPPVQLEAVGMDTDGKIKPIDELKHPHYGKKK